MTIADILLYGGVALWSAIVAYGVIQKVLPIKESAEQEVHTHTVSLPPPPPPPATVQGFDATQGFKSFQQGTELTVEDIVKGLSR